MRTVLISALLLACLSLAAQESAQVFAPGVISTGHEFTVTFTPDGKQVFFTRRDADKKVNHVFRSDLVNGTWQPAVALSFSSDQWSDLDPALSPDGKLLYFVSTRPRPGETHSADGKPDMDIWVSKRKGNDWGTPQWVEGVFSFSKEGSPTIDRHGNLCFFSAREIDGKNRIYCTHGKGAKFSRLDLAMLPPPINSAAGDTSPWLSPDGKILLFYSERPGGAGQADLYMSVRKKDYWGDPVNLGPAVNTDKYEYNPSLSPDRKTLYFGRDRAIYFIPVASVPALSQALADTR